MGWLNNFWGGWLVKVWGFFYVAKLLLTCGSEITSHLSFFHFICFGSSPQFVPNDVRTLVSFFNLFLSLASMEITNFSEELRFIKVISIALFFACFDRVSSAIAWVIVVLFVQDIYHVIGDFSFS